MLFYDTRDLPEYARRGLKIPYWLDDLGARPITEARPEHRGFLFSCVRGDEDYEDLLRDHHQIHERPASRAPLLRLDAVLEIIERAQVCVPRPRTWRMELEDPLPKDMAFPLFVRTVGSSWKRGGKISKVHTTDELTDESEQLRRTMGWDAVILAREWLDLVEAGGSMYGPIPQEVRTWLVDGRARAWSFHHLHAVPHPKGFPLGRADLAELKSLAQETARAFRARLIAADFVRRKNGGWCFLEAGPGGCAGTAHEGVFKAVARALEGREHASVKDAFGGTF